MNLFFHCFFPADLPDMWERTITIRSAGKTFSVTGWKLGWSIGPANLIQNCRVMAQNVTYTCPTPIQEAVAVGFETERDRIATKEGYFHELPRMLLEKRDRMADMLQKAGFSPTIPEGGYFMLADYSKLKNMPDLPKNEEAADSHFVKWMIKEKKLATIPVSAFYSQQHKHLAEEYIRFCFCKVIIGICQNHISIKVFSNIQWGRQDMDLELISFWLGTATLQSRNFIQ